MTTLQTRVDLVSSFELAMMSNGWTPVTIKARLEVVRRVSREAGIPPEDLALEHVIRFFARPMSANTRQTYFFALRTWFNWLIRDGHRLDDPTIKLPNPKVPTREPRTISTEHVRRLLANDILRDSEQVRPWIKAVYRDTATADNPALRHLATTRRTLKGSTMPELDHHGGPKLPGLQDIPRSSIETGRFGRLFRHLPPLRLGDLGQETPALQAIAAGMLEPAGGWSADPTAEDNTAIPAGYTYLAQFVDHDFTFDSASSLDRENDPNALENTRTPRFDLDSVYGGGPKASPYPYDKQDPTSCSPSRTRTLVSSTCHETTRAAP